MANIQQLTYTFRFSMRVQDGIQATVEYGEIVDLVEGDDIEVERHNLRERVQQVVRADISEVLAARKGRK